MRERALALAFLVALAGPLSAASGDSHQTTLVYPPFGHCLGMHRITDFHRFIYLGTRTKLDDPTGIAAVKLNAKNDPATEGDDDELTVFGLNSGRCEIVYNSSLYEAKIYGECGSGRGQFRNPLGIAADAAGNVFVADTGNDRIVRLLYDADGLRFVKAFGSTGSDDRQFRGPSQVALGASGTVYVTDTGNDRIAVMTNVGEPLRHIEGDAAAAVRLERPTGLAVVEADDPWITRKRHFIVVSDRDGARLLKFSLDGALQAMVEADDLPVADPSFDYLAIDFYGSVYATDGPNCRIHKFDWSLHYVTSFGRCGRDDGELDDPRGIALWRRFGQIFVAERAGAQYFWIGTEIQGLEADPVTFEARSGNTTISYGLTEVARVTVELLDGRGEIVRTLVRNRRRATGQNCEHWNGTLGRRKGPVPPGRYTLRLTATPTYSSGEYFHDTAEIQLEIAAPATP